MAASVSPRELVLARAGELSALADAWLADGASIVEIYSGNSCLWSRGSPPADSSPCLTTLFRVEQCGEFRLNVRGVCGPSAQRRLDVEARLLATNLELDDVLQRMTAELIDTQDQLLAVFGLARATRRHLGLEDTLPELVAEVCHLTAAELAFTVVPDVGPSGPVCYPPPPENWVEMLFRAAGWATSSGTLLLTGGAADAGISFVVPPGVRNVCAVPVEIDGRSAGALGVINQRDTRFSAGTVKLLQALAAQAGGLIESASLHERALAQERLHRGIELAAAIQAALMPRTAPDVRGIELVGRFRPAAEVGGDFYDYRLRTDGKLAVCVGDVSGKGWPAALVMTMTLGVLRGVSQAIGAPDMVIKEANADLYEDLTGVDAFVTAFFGLYDPIDRRIHYASAGHSPAVYRARGGRPRLLPATGVPLGLEVQSGLQSNVVRMGSGDLLVVATDGFTEARNPAGELFGYSRMLALVDAIADLTAADGAERMFDIITKFAAGRPQDDDQTLLIVKGGLGG